jgi:hypothetical protein
MKLHLVDIIHKYFLSSYFKNNYKNHVNFQTSTMFAAINVDEGKFSLSKVNLAPEVGHEFICLVGGSGQ